MIISLFETKVIFSFFLDCPLYLFFSILFYWEIKEEMFAMNRTLRFSFSILKKSCFCSKSIFPSSQLFNSIHTHTDVQRSFLIPKSYRAKSFSISPDQSIGYFYYFIRRGWEWWTNKTLCFSGFEDRKIHCYWWEDTSELHRSWIWDCCCMNFAQNSFILLVETAGTAPSV